MVCQKPFCGGLDGAREAVRAASRAGIRLVVHENVRFQPWYGAVADELAGLGALYGATFRLRPGDGQGERAYTARQPYFRTMERFLVHETLVHWIDTFRFLFGEVAAVWADLRRINGTIAGEDAGLVVLEFACGLRGLIDANRCADHAATDRRRTLGELRVEGAQGELFLSGDADLSRRLHGENAWLPVPFAWEDIGFGGDCVFRLQSRLVEALATGHAMPNEGAAYLRNLEIVEAAYASARAGRRVAL